MLSFYVTYLAYRNLKSVVPLLRPDELFDRRLGGPRPQPVRRPATRPRCCTTLLGTGVSAARAVGHLRAVLRVRPGRRSRSRSWSRRDLRAGLFFATALVAQLGAGGRRATSCCRRSGRSTPSRTTSRTCRHTGVSAAADGAARPADRLPARPGGRRRGAEHRRVRVAARLDLLHRRARDPPARRPRGACRGGLGRCSALTVLATLYFGWHYVLDDVAGMAHRGHVARAGAGADRLRAARPPAGACPPQPSPA